MNVSGIQSGLTGIALFDMWMAAVRKAQDGHKPEGAPLVAAAAEAFEAFVRGQEVVHSAQIAGAAAYALNPGGGSASPLTSQQLAPFLALNVLA